MTEASSSQLAGAAAGPGGLRPQPMESLRAAGWSRFRRNSAAVPGLILIVLVFAAVLVGPLVYTVDPDRIQVELGAVPPLSPAHLLGTDYLGRDMLARVLDGGRVSLAGALLVVGASVAIGIVLGSIAGYFRGWIDALIMRIVDVLLAFPFLILALGVVATIGPGLVNAMVTLALVSWVGYARVLRGQILAVREMEFVEAAKVIGASAPRVLLLHVLPSSIQPTTVQASLGLATTLLTLSGLSFLGLGAQPPSPEWGAMLKDGQGYLTFAPWMAIEPGLAIMLCALAINVVGDGLRDALDPRATPR